MNNKDKDEVEMTDLKEKLLPKYDSLPTPPKM
jgi:hypothetical protein